MHKQSGPVYCCGGCVCFYSPYGRCEEVNGSQPAAVVGGIRFRSTATAASVSGGWCCWRFRVSSGAGCPQMKWRRHPCSAITDCRRILTFNLAFNFGEPGGNGTRVGGHKDRRMEEARENIFHLFPFVHNCRALSIGWHGKLLMAGQLLWDLWQVVLSGRKDLLEWCLERVWAHRREAATALSSSLLPSAIILPFSCTTTTAVRASAFFCFPLNPQPGCG